MDDDFYNYFPTDTSPDDFGQTIVLDPFVVTDTRGGNDGDGSIDDGVSFPNDDLFDGSGAFPLSDDDDTLGGWWDSFVSGVSSAFTPKPGAPAKPGTSSGASSSSGGKSSSTSTTKTTSSVFSDTGISPLVLFGMGALLLAAVYIGRNTK